MKNFSDEIKLINNKKRIYKVNLFCMIITLWRILLTIVCSIFPISSEMSDFILTLVAIWMPAFIYLRKMKKHGDHSIKQVLKINKVYFSDIIYSVLLIFCSKPINKLINFFIEIFIEIIVSSPVENFKLTPSTNVLFSFIIIALLGPIGEEVIMRGIVLDGYKNSKSIFFMAIMNGVLFGILHVNPLVSIGAGFLGFLMAYVTIYTNSIFPAIIMHILNNTIVISKIHLNLHIDFYTSFIDNHSVITVVIVFIVRAIIGGILIKIILNKIKNKNNWKKPILEEEHRDDIEERKSFSKKDILSIYWPVIVLAVINLLCVLIII